MSIKKRHQAPRGHWVGDAFPVRSLLFYGEHGESMSPFLLLDRAGPYDFEASETHQRGVGQHPHRGFETVTLIYEGEVSHRDSAGFSDTIGPGEVQWMTAAAGVLHEEYHSKRFAQAGGRLDMVQLWVNLPAAEKMSKPRYQALVRDMLPVHQLNEQGVTGRVIAGSLWGHQGPAHTVTPMQVADADLKKGQSVVIPVTNGWHSAIFVLHGAVTLCGEQFDPNLWAEIDTRNVDHITVHAETDARILWLSGEPIHEPIVGRGPFVMNTRQELMQAFIDFEQGHFGELAEK